MAPRQIAVQLVSLGEHRGHKVIEGRPLAGPIYRFCILAADHRSRPSFIGRLHTEAELPTENGRVRARPFNSANNHRLSHQVVQIAQGGGEVGDDEALELGVLGGIERLVGGELVEEVLPGHRNVAALHKALLVGFLDGLAAAM